MSYRRIHLAALSLGLGLLASFGVLASTDFPERIQLENHALQRIGSGTARYGGIIRVYDAALYAPSRSSRADILDTAVPKRLEIVYHRSIEAELLAEAAQHTLERQHGTDVLDRWRYDIQRLHAAYRDVSDGDRFALAVVPGQGVTLEFNGREVARIDEPEFGRIYFGIWLGDEPLSASLRDALLPKNCCQPN